MRRAACLMVGLLTGCGKAATDWVQPAEATGAAIRVTAVVLHSEIERGFFAIRGEESGTYDPTNLPKAFQQDRLRVEAVADRRDDMIGTRQVGPIVEIERIRAR